MNITWDAKGYTSGFAFVHQYGEGVLDLIDAAPGSHIVDLGCGNGALERTRDGQTTPLVYCGGTRFLSLDPADPDAQGVRHEFLIRDGVAWGVRCGTRVFERMSV